MHILRQFRAFVGAIPRGSVRREARRYLATASECRIAQQRVLRRLLKLNGDSRFSHEHRLADVRTTADFRSRLPVADYEFFRPWIERLKQGDHAALLGRRNRLLMFSLSSGTTAESKFIPITVQFFRDYKRGWQIWGIHALDAHPGINSRNIVQISSDYDRFRTPGGTPCGNISGLVADLQKRIVKTMYTLPAAVAKIDDPAAKNYTALRIALADAHVGMVMTANPSTLIQLAKLADEYRDDLIRDIFQGTLSPAFEIPKPIRRRLGLALRRRRDRARKLEQIIARTGHLYPRDCWDENQLVAVWTGGSAGAYLDPLRRYYGDISVRDHGLSASEGRMTIPLHDGRADGLLDVHTHYFEFIPEAEYGRPDPVVLEAHELDEGCNYYVLLTTSSGLYRYNICDVVRCTGHYGTTPLLEFLHKGSSISNITGEKISESQVVSAVRRSIQPARIHLEAFTISPLWDDPPRYQLLVEEQELSSSHRALLVARVDSTLQELNCEYRDKRRSGRLAPMACVPLPAGTWQALAMRRQQRIGGCMEQYKHPCLVPDLDFYAEIERLLESLSRRTRADERASNSLPNRSGVPEQAA